MNAKQRTLLIVAAAFALVLLAFPPWNTVFRGQYGQFRTTNAGYASVFTPPPNSTSNGSLEIDWFRLGLPLGIVVVAGFGGYLGLATRHT